MSIHAIHYNDDKGNLNSIDYFCDHHCMIHMLTDFGTDFEPFVAGEAPIDYGHAKGTIEYGEWPGGEETDEDVYCAHCHDKLWNGIEAECRRDDEAAGL